MISFRHILLVSAAALSLGATAQKAGGSSGNKEWFCGVSVGGALAFGDDSYNVFSDLTNAAGLSASLYAGKDFSKTLSGRVSARYNKLYSRVNLETLSLRDHDPEKYSGLFPRDGFYGYSCLGLQADVLFNPLNLIPGRPSDFFNLYVIGGAGVNATCGYSECAKWWSRDSGLMDGGWYEVDTGTHIMPCAMIGGMLDFRLTGTLHLNLELDCTFTGDNLEGVVSQEFYDAYVTASIGLTAHF